MSNEQSNDSVEEVVKAEETSESTVKKDEYVLKNAYEEVSRDMHKNKAKYKEERARANELETKLKAIEEAKLVEAGEWKEAYEKIRKEKEEAESKAADREKRTEELTKRSALRQELGNIREEYLDHAKLSEIEIDENGAVSSDSVREVANKFRQEHSVLLPKTTASTNLTSQAATTTGVVTQTGEKLLSELTTEQKFELMIKKREEAGH